MIIGMTTAPRANGVSYLKQTCDSLAKAGAKRVHVFAEPGTDSSVIAPETPGTCSFVVENHLKRKGNWFNWLYAATECCWLSRRYFDWSVLICEDDVVFSDQAISKSEEILRDLCFEDDNVGFLALYTSSMYQNRMTKPVEARDLKSMWGACALLFESESLERIIDSERASRWRGIADCCEYGSPDTQHADHAIGDACIDLGLRGYFMRPCLAQHIGEVSSLRPGTPLTPERVADAFAAEVM